MRQIVWAEQLRAEGLSANEWCRMADRNELLRLRRGAYLRGGTPSSDELERYRRLIEACVPLLSPSAVVSHTSAALLHGLPVRTSDLGTVSVTRSRLSGGRIAGPVHLYPAALPPEHVMMLDEIPVTTPARTVVDLGRHSGLSRGVAVADAALRLGLSREELALVVKAGRRRPGIVTARRAAALADGRSESVGESFSRVTLIRLGLAPSHLQYEVHDRFGLLVGRSDFCWEQHRTLGEFDGKIKYGSLVPDGRSANDVLFAEKQREDALRALGWEVVRWVWDDLRHPERIAERLHSAFERAARRG